MKCLSGRLVQEIKWFLLPAGLLVLGSVAFAGPGFGTLRKKGVELKVREPAAVRLANTSIAFVGSSSNREYTPVQESLLATLSTELLKNEKSLSRAPQSEAQWIFQAEVTGYEVSQPQQRSEVVGSTTTRYVQWNGSLNVAYQVLDRSGHVHDAGNVSKNYNKEFQEGVSGGKSLFGIGTPSLGRSHKDSSKERIPATTEDLKQILIGEVVSDIASNLGNTSRAILVQVAGGDTNLDRAADFMQQDLWSRALEQLENTPAFEKPDAESYRQYDLGLAYEAMSYSAKDPKEARADIFKAGEYYDKALEMNPKEKYFVETVARTRDAAARYEALDRMEKEDVAAAKNNPPHDVKPPATEKISTGGKASGGAPPADGKTVAKPYTITDVIELYTAGAPEDQIIEVIRNSPIDFNPHDKDTVLAITKAKLPIVIQNELRKKVGAPLLATPASQRATARKTQ
jgi:hypothetical protein